MDRNSPRVEFKPIVDVTDLLQMDQPIRTKSREQTLELIASSGTPLSEETATGVYLSGKLIAAGGLIPMWQGVANAWAIITPEALPYLRQMAREARKRLPEMMEHYEVHRVQAENQHPLGQVARLLGFQFEGTLREYDEDRNTYDVYSRLATR